MNAPAGELGTLAGLAGDCGGRLGGGADPAKAVTGVGIDSRTTVAGELFVALVGDHFDGHAYTGAAHAAGAVCSVVERPVSSPYLLVDSALLALADLARTHLARLTARVTAVTGSVGKTSTKDLLAAVLSELGPTVAPPGSHNNDIGLPLTVLAATAATRHLVLEMGARAGGDIARLCRVAPPATAVVLNVGTAHLGEFGSREAIAVAKSELVVAASDLVVLNADDPRVAAMATLTRARVRTFGAGGEVRAEGLVLDAGGRPGFRLVAPEGTVPVRMLLVGAHQVPNALAAATVALSEGASVESVGAVLGRARPRSHWRMEVTERSDGLTVVNDAYNANPESVRAALDALIAVSRPGGRRWAVLGEMLELGAEAPDAHRDIGAYAARVGVDAVLAVGEGARPIADGARTAGAWAEWAVDAEEALAWLREQVRAVDVVLVKASRAVGLEGVAAGLLQDDPVTADGRRG